MAIGVPESEVFAAADAVLARGERPTVERVRLELGRGSPARVGQLLEAWWEQLAQRLKGYALLPDLPGEVAQGFAEVWRLALLHAEASARATLAEDQNALFAAQSDLTQERKLWEIALAEAQRQLADAAARATQAELQRGERQALVDQLEAQLGDLLQQRDRLQAQLEQQQINLQALRAERTALQDHVRAVEDRAHRQVDHSRQEHRTVQQQLERAQRDHAKAITHFAGQLEALQATARAAERTAAHEAGRAAALEATIAQWRRTQAPVPPAGRRTAKASGKATTRRRTP